jgi:hypothetical protein
MDKKEAALDEIRQLHKRSVFIPINISTMTLKEKNKQWKA